MNNRSFLAWVVLTATSLAFAEAPRDRFSAGGYFRIMTRPDFQGGNSKLGYWNLYGRLLNEGPYAAMEMKLDLVQGRLGTSDTFASVHTRLEGGSVSNVDAGNGALNLFRMSQLYVKAGNILLDKVTWQLGTLDYWYGDLGVYDLRPATLFNDTVGLSARYTSEKFELLLGLGDSGFHLKGPNYSTVFSGGGGFRARPSRHFEFGAGGQVGYEPSVEGNRFAPYYTPGIDYEDYYRGEVAQRYLEKFPGQAEMFPDPIATDALSYRLIGYLGFGRLGPIQWNNLYALHQKLHPQAFKRETVSGQVFDLYTTKLTDERTLTQLGNEMILTLWPQKLDAVWAVFYGREENRDNTLAAGEDNREYLSTVLRLQYYVTPTVHFLVESSGAQEKSLNGNLFRQHVDSIFANTSGVSDSRGLEFGDTDTRTTWQFKTGIVLNPNGRGIYSRPSLRLLYGLQYSNQQAAFGNGFVESLDQFNDFQSQDRHWHSVVAIESEGWF